MDFENRIRKLTDQETERLVKLYLEIENEILNKLSKAAAKGNDTTYLNNLKNSIRKTLKDLRKGNKQWADETVRQFYEAGLVEADRQVDKLVQQGIYPPSATEEIKISTAFGKVNAQAIEVLQENIYNRLDQVAIVVGRQVDDYFRQVQLSAIKLSTTGAETYKQSAKRIEQQLLDKGITAFTDKMGRNWSLKTYSDMAARTTLMQTMTEGTVNRLVQRKVYLGKISSHSNPCPKCEPWQGRVVNLVGDDSQYPTLEEAKDSGLLHPNCRHVVSAYIEL